MVPRWLCLALAFTAACGPDWTPPSPPDRSFSAEIQPAADSASAPDVVRVRIEGAEGRSALGDFRLFSGTLSAYHLGRIAARELPSTLREREVPAAVWSERDVIVVSPTQALELGVHSLATPELGLVLEFTVTRRTTVIERWWPPREYADGVAPLVYCGDISTVSLGPIVLPPAGVPARVESGVDATGQLAERCVRVLPAVEPLPGTLLLPPLSSGDIALDPAVLRHAPSESPAEDCTGAEVSIGPVCAEIGDDRVVFRAFAVPALIALSAPQVWAAVVVPGGSAVLRGLEPSTSYALSGTLFELGSGEAPFAVEFSTLAARAHIVIDEVLSDPAGVERTSEWVELTNDGVHPASLSGMTFEDVGGLIALPDVVVAPGERVLLVEDDFAPDPELDLLPEVSTRLVPVSALGKGGLSNQGELLRLRDAKGTVISRFPAEKSGQAGRSVARCTPDAPDDAPSSFGPHAAPGASPGKPNAVEP